MLDHTPITAEPVVPPSPISKNSSPLLMFTWPSLLAAMLRRQPVESVRLSLVVKPQLGVTKFPGAEQSISACTECSISTPPSSETALLSDVGSLHAKISMLTAQRIQRMER